LADGDGGNDKQVGSFGVVRVTVAVGNGKRQARLPMNNFEKLLE
jgi:hypothetical protein